MRVIRIDTRGVSPARPTPADHLSGGQYLRFAHGEEGRGRKLVVIPLGTRDFPAAEGPPAPEQEYTLVPVSDRRAHILTRGVSDGARLVLWSLSPGFRGSASYRIEGEARLIAEGYEADGIAGRMGGAPCPVALATGPCSLRWERTGRLYGSEPNWLASYDGREWLVAPETPDTCAVEIACG